MVAITQHGCVPKRQISWFPQEPISRCIGRPSSMPLRSHPKQDTNEDRNNSSVPTASSPMSGQLSCVDEIQVGSRPLAIASLQNRSTRRQAGEGLYWTPIQRALVFPFMTTPSLHRCSLRRQPIWWNPVTAAGSVVPWHHLQTVGRERGRACGIRLRSGGTRTQVEVAAL